MTEWNFDKRHKYIYKLCDDEDCWYCFTNSFASEPRCEFWSRKNALYPRQVNKLSTKAIWFDCDECSHSFKAKLASVVRKNRWCPYCDNRKLCKDDDCVECFDKSLASCEYAHLWSATNEQLPREVWRYSYNKYWFDCDNCPHTFAATALSINRGLLCPFCRNRKLCGTSDCKTCYVKSFATHPMSYLWGDKNDVQAVEVLKNSMVEYWFYCSTCKNEFKLSLRKVCRGHWCTRCAQSH
jgi:hypothetical protein